MAAVSSPAPNTPIRVRGAGTGVSILGSVQAPYEHYGSVPATQMAEQGLLMHEEVRRRLEAAEGSVQAEVRHYEGQLAEVGYNLRDLQTKAQRLSSLHQRAEQGILDSKREGEQWGVRIHELRQAPLAEGDSRASHAMSVTVSGLGAGLRLAIEECVHGLNQVQGEAAEWTRRYNMVQQQVDAVQEELREAQQVEEEALHNVQNWQLRRNELTVISQQLRRGCPDLREISMKLRQVEVQRAAWGQQ